MRQTVLIIALSVLASLPAFARDLHVDPRTGDDRNSGAPSSALATAQKAVDIAQAGDVIHLHPQDALYRQSISLRGKADITIEGNGVTLDGSDPLPASGWEDLGDGLKRLRLPQTT